MSHVFESWILVILYFNAKILLEKELIWFSATQVTQCRGSFDIMPVPVGYVVFNGMLSGSILKSEVVAIRA